MTAVDHGHVGWQHGQPRKRQVPQVEVAQGVGPVEYDPRHPETQRLAARVYHTQEAAGRAYGRIKGYAGKPGGWIYNRQGKCITQGWANIAFRHVRYDQEARGYRFGETALRRLDEWLDRQ